MCLSHIINSLNPDLGGGGDRPFTPFSKIRTWFENRRGSGLYSRPSTFIKTRALVHT
jgi:hypothetical protein